jgi:hypothetical protein
VIRPREAETVTVSDNVLPLLPPPGLPPPGPPVVAEEDPPPPPPQAERVAPRKRTAYLFNLELIHPHIYLWLSLPWQISQLGEIKP